MKNYCYLIEDDRVLFYKGTVDGTTVWSADPDAAFDFPSAWVPAEPTSEIPNRTQRFVNLSEPFADTNGARRCIGDPRAMASLHERGPRIGQRVRVKRHRSDGHDYGTGYVCGYVCGYVGILPHYLTHTVMLDDPPATGAADEFGNACAAPEILGKHHCPVSELETL